MRGFETHEHEYELAQWLAQRRVPLKFAYAGDAAVTHGRLASAESYHKNVGSARQEAAVIHAATGGHVPAQLADAGPGNGQAAREFLVALSELGEAPDRYLALDFSRRLMEMSRRSLGDLQPVDSRWKHWDFEAAPTPVIEAWRIGRPVLLTLLGLTLCNVEDPEAVLTNLRRSARPGDVVALNVGTVPDDIETLLSGYRTTVLELAAIEPLMMAGFERDAGVFDVAFDPIESAVVGHWTISQQSAVQLAEQRLEFMAGDRIRCFLSRRFTADGLDKLIAGAAMRLLKQDVDKLSGHVVLVFEVA